jgi:hypothetical protein
MSAGQAQTGGDESATRRAECARTPEVGAA